MSVLDALQMLMSGLLFVGAGFAFLFGLRSIDQPIVRRVRRTWFIAAFVGVAMVVVGSYYLIEMFNHHTTYYRATN
jgi:hypothetical protein